MAELVRMSISGVQCDGSKCESEIRDTELPLISGQDHYARLAVARGWTCWVGRSRRWYCPTCQPRPGHKMSLLYGEPRDAE